MTMAIKTLQPLLHPSGIAVVGGSDHAGTVGRTVIDNLVTGGFDKAIYAINPRRVEHPDANWVGSVADLPDGIDVAVICTPPATVPGLVTELGRHGIKVAIVLTGGVDNENGRRAALVAAAKAAGVRLIGPNSVGLVLPHAHLNASFARGCARAGDLAMITQSGAISTGVIDWADRSGIGFSGVVSCGDAIDTDMADLIDLFAADERTRAILVHLEGLTDARRFLAAARAASRSKPVIALKAGRDERAAKAAQTHSGALAGSFEIYAAAFRRAGIVMVDTLSELFAAAEMLDLLPRLHGKKLGIVTNGGGAAILALDTLAQAGGTPADLHPDTIRSLNAALPAAWSHANPVDILGDADAERYEAAIAALDSDPAVDALLVMNCPIGMTDAPRLSDQVSRVLGAARKPAFGCWLGGANFDRASADFAAARVPLFNMPEDAIRAFGHLLEARRAAETSRTAFAQVVPNGRGAARAIVDAARADGRTMLSEPEAQRLLAAYRISVVPSRVVAGAAEVAQACAQLQPPYAVKIVSPAGLHKSDIGGVTLDLANGLEAAAAAERMAATIGRDHPDVVLSGFIVEAMVKRPQGFELVAGIANDPTFGPVIMVGAGGKAVEVLRDRAFGLPPLDEGFARDMLDATRIARLLHGYRDQPPAAIEAITQVLCTLSAIAIDLPDLLELDINPLLADPTGAVALDARIRLGASAAERSEIAICPIPNEWNADLVTRTGDAIHVRPASPADVELIAGLFHATACEDLRFRFGTARELPAARIRELVDVDYARSITFLALHADGTAAAAATIDRGPDGDEAAITLTVREDCKGRGISWTLMEHMLRYTSAQGIRTVNAVQNVNDERALQLEHEMGFAVAGAADDEDDLKLSKAVS